MKRQCDLLNGRFLSQDPIWQRGGINAYVYGFNDPLRFRDSLGLDGEDFAYEMGLTSIPASEGPEVQAEVAGTAMAFATVYGGLAAAGAVAAVPAVAAEGGADVIVFCATNPGICTSAAGGFVSGLTDTKLPPSGTTTLEQYLAGRATNYLGQWVQNACSK